MYVLTGVSTNEIILYVLFIVELIRKYSHFVLFFSLGCFFLFVVIKSGYTSYVPLYLYFILCRYNIPELFGGSQEGFMAECLQ